MKDYFSVGKAVEAELRDKMGADVNLICSPFTANSPDELKKAKVSLHVSMLPSSFGNSTGNGARQAETQRWQVSLCFVSPKTAAEENEMRDKAGALCLKLRQTLQGFNPPDAEAKPLRAAANSFYMTDDCRFRIFGFVFESDCVI